MFFDIGLTVCCSGSLKAMTEQMAQLVGRGPFEKTPNHKVNDLCFLAPAYVHYAASDIIL
jgi:hypothetical protein